MLLPSALPNCPPAALFTFQPPIASSATSTPLPLYPSTTEQRRRLPTASKPDMQSANIYTACCALQSLLSSSSETTEGGTPAPFRLQPSSNSTMNAKRRPTGLLDSPMDLSLRKRNLKLKSKSRRFPKQPLQLHPSADILTPPLSGSSSPLWEKQQHQQQQTKINRDKINKKRKHTSSISISHLSHPLYTGSPAPSSIYNDSDDNVEVEVEDKENTAASLLAGTLPPTPESMTGEGGSSGAGPRTPPPLRLRRVVKRQRRGLGKGVVQKDDALIEEGLMGLENLVLFSPFTR